MGYSSFNGYKNVFIDIQLMDILKQKNRVEIFFWSLISKMRDKSQIWQVIVNENYSELFASGK